MPNRTTEESRRIKTYREMSRVKRWEETLRFVRDSWRLNAVRCAAANNPTGASYYNGKADGVEDLIERIRNSSKITRSKKHEDEDGEEEVIGIG